MTIIAKYDAICHQCHTRIRPGDIATYDANRPRRARVAHITCSRPPTQVYPVSPCLDPRCYCPACDRRLGLQVVELMDFPLQSTVIHECKCGASWSDTDNLIQVGGM